MNQIKLSRERGSNVVKVEIVSEKCVAWSIVRSIEDGEADNFPIASGTSKSFDLIESEVHTDIICVIDID